MQRQTKQKRRLPHRLQAKLRNCPKAGSGVHRWIFNSALQLTKYTDQNTAFELIRSSSAGCERFVPDREIRDATLLTVQLHTHAQVREPTGEVIALNALQLAMYTPKEYLPGMVAKKPRRRITESV